MFNPEPGTADFMAMPYLDEQPLAKLHFQAQQKRMMNELTTQLIGIYPTVHQVLGDAQSAEVAQAYFYKHPPKTAHPVDAVEMFAYFLESHSKAKTFPFLPDVATMDLGYHKAYHAVNAQTIHTGIFTELTPEQLAAKRIQLHPACFWFSSSYAVHDMWRLHHSAIPPKHIDNHISQDVIILRPHLNVEVHKIDAGFTNALDRLDAGETMEMAFMRASQIDPNFKPVAAIQFLIQNNLIVSLY